MNFLVSSLSHKITPTIVPINFFLKYVHFSLNSVTSYSLLLLE